jgi:hypothetical protein
LRKQWHQELQDKFSLQGLILEAKNYNAIRKQEQQSPFLMASGPIICSYQFAKAKANDIKEIAWDLVVLDADIYQNCRNPSEIKASFEQLQLDLSGEITEAMVKTRQILLENFDEEVQDKLRVRAEDSSSARSRFERMLMDLSRAELGDCASFDDDGFHLWRTPDGRYELPRRSGGAHLYRINHPLALWITEQAKTRALDGAKLVFDYGGYGTKVSTLEPYRGRAGWFTLKLVSSRSWC